MPPAECPSDHAASDLQEHGRHAVMPVAKALSNAPLAETLASRSHAVDKGEFRRALGAFPTGVAVITTRAQEGCPVGVTCNSFNSVSLDPSLVLWSLAKTARSRRAFEAAQYWAVNLLSVDQEALSNRFARSGGDKFTDLETEAGFGNVPMLAGCCARFQCMTHFICDGGDHIILVGQALGCDRFERTPLVFHSGKYCYRTSETIAAAHRVQQAVGD